MLFDPNNEIVKLCAQGMALEGEGKPGEAAIIFMNAWNGATNDVEKFIAAHYVARHQESIEAKLKWDELALKIALNIKETEIRSNLPSLYLNIAKGYEDLNNYELAHKHYQSALLYSDELPETGYSKLIKGGILNGIERVKKQTITNFKNEQTNT